MNREPLLDTTVDSLAAGGEGVARDPSGRVTFIPGTAPGDRVKLRVLKTTSTYARGEVVELVKGGASRVEPACPHAMRVGGRQPAPVCGGCQWQHVSRSEQLAAKQAIVTGALRKLDGLRVHPIEDPCPPLGWRRRARFHVERGVVGCVVVQLGGLGRGVDATGPPQPRGGELVRAQGETYPRTTVRPRIPSVARSAPSEMTGKMPASRHTWSISDQS